MRNATSPRRTPSDEIAALASDAIEVLARLVAFDTTSSRSNLELVNWVEAYLERHGIVAERVESPDGRKANLWATIGPDVDGGIVLSGHTDVVPVEGQPWTSDPFQLVERDGRLYGRGTSDMKSFLALALAAVPGLKARSPARPVHLALSYDEEVGCLGAPALIAELKARGRRPSAVIVGEPTSLKVVNSHKSINIFEVIVTGREAHSSLVLDGVSANMAAIELLGTLARISRREAADHLDPRFDPPSSTLTVGTIQGGTAPNILARECRFTFDLRCIPSRDPDEVLADFHRAVAELQLALAVKGDGLGVSVRALARVPCLRAEAGGVAEGLAATFSGSNQAPAAVAYGAEAGQFQAAGFSTVICGPGSITQAHTPDEFIERRQIEEGARFLQRLSDFVCANP